MLLQYQQQLGNRWCEISKLLLGRPENAVKNRYNSLVARLRSKEALGGGAQPALEDHDKVATDFHYQQQAMMQQSKDFLGMHQHRWLAANSAEFVSSGDLQHLWARSVGGEFPEFNEDVQVYINIPLPLHPRV